MDQSGLPSASVSRKHAKLVLSGPQPFIVDEGSANGVIVNGVRIAGPTGCCGTGPTVEKSVTLDHAGDAGNVGDGGDGG